MQLKVLSWNMWVDCHFEDFRAFVASADADIIALQEMREHDPERDVVKLMKDLGYTDSALGLKQLWKTHDFYFGPAIFTKNKIISSKVHNLSQEHERFAVRADIQFGPETLHVFSAHLIHTHQAPSDVQLEQAQNLLNLLPAERTIVAGDFNATPDSGVIQKMTSALNNTDPSNTPTWSMYPAGCHVCNPQAVDIRLDYIFASKDLKTRSPAVDISKASDHLPISVIVEI
jgi:endonuclease/exonuclease/phosphatase family metal-dependent hydrolase